MVLLDPKRLVPPPVRHGVHMQVGVGGQGINHELQREAHRLGGVVARVTGIGERVEI